MPVLESGSIENCNVGNIISVGVKIKKTVIKHVNYNYYNLSFKAFCIENCNVGKKSRKL